MVHGCHIRVSGLDQPGPVHSEVSKFWHLRRDVHRRLLHICSVFCCLLSFHYCLWTGILHSSSAAGISCCCCDDLLFVFYVDNLSKMVKKCSNGHEHCLILKLGKGCETW